MQEWNNLQPRLGYGSSSLAQQILAVHQSTSSPMPLPSSDFSFQIALRLQSNFPKAKMGIELAFPALLVQQYNHNTILWCAFSTIMSVISLDLAKETVIYETFQGIETLEEKALTLSVLHTHPSSLGTSRVGLGLHWQLECNVKDLNTSYSETKTKFLLSGSLALKG